MRSLPALLIAAALTLFASPPAQTQPDPRFGVLGAAANPEAAAGLGVGWEVVEFRWDALQPTGPADWQTTFETGDYLAQAAGAGREVVGVLAGTPAWATGGSPGTGVPRGLHQPPDDPDNTWAAFVRQAVHYGAVRGVNRWAVWRGQDVPADMPGATWEGSLRDYYRLVEVAALVARQTNPNAVIHLGAVGEGDPAWLEAFLEMAAADPQAHGQAATFDVVGVHASGSPEQVYARIRALIDTMNQEGVPLKEVWATGVGLRAAVDPEADELRSELAEHPNVTLAQQAAYLVQAHALGFAAAPGVRLAANRLADSPDAPEMAGFGLLREDGSARHTYEAYRMLLRELGGFTSARRIRVEDHPEVAYVQFAFPDRLTHVAWATTQQTTTLLIPARSREAVLVDVQGNRAALQPEDGHYRLVVEAATCDDPRVGCLVGGMPWLLVEQGARPQRRGQPDVTAQPGGEPMAITATLPPPTSTLGPTTSPAPTQSEAAAVPTEAGPAISTPLPNATLEPTRAPATRTTPETAEPSRPGWLLGGLIAAAALGAAGGAAYLARRSRRRA